MWYSSRGSYKMGVHVDCKDISKGFLKDFSFHTGPDSHLLEIQIYK